MSLVTWSPPYIVVGGEEKVEREEEKDWALPLSGCSFGCCGLFLV